MADLFEGCSDDEVTLKTDNSYAKRYDEWRRKEELMKAKARYGSDLENSSSSSSDEEEDDEASQWTSEHERKFLTTLSALKAKDPKIYNKDEIIFPEVATPQQSSKETSSANNKMTLKDYERKIMTTEGGIYADEDDERSKKELFEETQHDRFAYDAEQRELRESFKKAAWGVEESQNDEAEKEESLLTKKESKTTKEEKEDEEEYVKWLKGETKKLSNKKDAKDLAGLKKLWSSEGDDNLDEAEKFLRDYVLNKKYLTVNENDCRFEVDFSEDEKDVEAMTEFEHKYNFRFEDPDPEFIKQYPRTIEDSMRRKDNRRVDKKAEKKARKEQMKIQMREEVNRIKSFKKKEILDKIERLKEIAGSGDIAFDDADVEDDFDPEAHDKRMAQLFSSYDDEAGEDVYPEIGENDHEDLRWENWDDYQGEGDREGKDGSSSREDKVNRSNDSDENGEISADSSENESDGPENETTKSRSSSAEKNQKAASEDSAEASHNNGDGIERNDSGKLLVRGKKSAKLVLSDILPEKNEKKRKKSKFAEAISKKKPSFDPEKDKSFEKYFDEYYKLDFEDVVAGMPTRFKYRQVIPNDFGLSTEEVLRSQDKELNKWCSLKKMVQVRSEQEENKDLQVFSKRRDHYNLKRKILTSAFAVEEEKMDEEIAEAAGKTQQLPAKKSKSRKNKKKKNLEEAGDKTQPTEDQAVDDTADLETGRANASISPGNQPELQSASPKKARKRKSEFSGMEKEGKAKRRNLELTQSPRKTQTPKELPSEFVASPAGDVKHNERSNSTNEGEVSQVSVNSVKSTQSIPWDQLTAKQKRNRRAVLTKKRKKLEQKQKQAETFKSRKQKFKPLEDLQISEARMKAYGLNPKRVKRDLVYGKPKSKKLLS